MAERFTRLYTMKSDLYLEGSPVIISAGALLNDTATANVIAQLKFKSIVNENISSVKVKIVCYDNAKRVIGEPYEYTYRDLNAPRGSEFGQKVPVVLPDNATRYVDMCVTEVVLVSGQILNIPEGKWESLPEQQSVAKAIGDFAAEVIEFEFDNIYRFIPQKAKDLWLCSCGAVNHSDENVCHNCGLAFEEACELVNKDHLTEKYNDRAYKNAIAFMETGDYQEAEAVFNQIKDYKDSAQQLEKIAEILKKKNAELAKIKKILLIIVGVVACCIAVAVIYTSVVSPMLKYKDALQLREDGKYDEAVALFTELDDYKDSAEQIEYCGLDEIYDTAIEHMKSSNLEDAKKLFKTLDGYRDSNKRIIEIEELKKEQKYQQAIELLDSGEYNKSKQAFIELGDYKDSAEKVKEIGLLLKGEKYLSAIALKNEGKYDDAIELFRKLNGYKDSFNQIAECRLNKSR